MVNESDFDVFDSSVRGKNRYGVFKIRKDTYLIVPLINKNIILKSFNLYNPTNSIKRIYKKIIVNTKVVARLNFIYEDIRKFKLKDYLLNIFKNINNVEYFSIYTGTPGKYSKYTIQLMDYKGNILGYAKVPKNQNSKKIIERELRNLKYVNNLNLKKSIIPKILLYDENSGVLIQSTQNAILDSNFNLTHIEVESLSEMYRLTSKKYKLKESSVYSHITKLREVKEGYVKNTITHVLEYFIKNGCLDKKYYFYYAHKDFASWNVKYKNDKLYIFDWEMAEETSAYFDIFHHIHFARVLVSKRSTHDILKELNNNKYIEQFENLTGLTDRKSYLILYAVEELYYYLICNSEDKENVIVKSCIEMLNAMIKS